MDDTEINAEIHLPQEAPRSTFRARLLIFVWQRITIIFIVTAVVLGILTGFLMKNYRKGGVYTKREVMYVEFIGVLYIRALKLVTLPLVTTNMIATLSKLNVTFAGMIGLRTCLYFLITTMLASAWGIFLVIIIAPGNEAEITDPSNGNISLIHVTVVDSVLDLIGSLCPENYVDAAIRTYRRQVLPPMIDVVDENGTVALNADGSAMQAPDLTISVYEWEYDYTPNDSTNYISICFFTIVVGIVSLYVAKSMELFREIFEELSVLVLLIVTIIAWSSPVGVFFLLCAKVIEEKHWKQTFVSVGWYAFTVIFGVVTYGLVFLELVYVAFVRKNPFTFTFNMIEALTTGFATASSLVTMPVTLRCVIEKNGIPPAIARLVIPLGASLNMNGAAVYESVAPIYISQLLKRKLTVVELFFTCILATLASIGAAGLPQSGLMTMVMVLSHLNLSTDAIVYILPMEWVVDRFCTALNIFGDAIAAAVMVPKVETTFHTLNSKHLHL